MEALARFKEHDIQPKVQSKEQELADEAPAVGGEVAALHHGGGGGGGGEAEHRQQDLEAPLGPLGHHQHGGRAAQTRVGFKSSNVTLDVFVQSTVNCEMFFYFMFFLLKE